MRISLSGSERGGCPPQCNPTGIALVRIASWAGYYNNVSKHLVWTRLWCNASPSQYARKMFLRNPFWVTPEAGGEGSYMSLISTSSGFSCCHFTITPSSQAENKKACKKQMPSNFPSACLARLLGRQPNPCPSHTHKQESRPVSKSKPRQRLPCIGKDKDPSHAQASRGW